MTKSPTDVVNAFMHAFAVMDYDTALGDIAPDSEYSNMPEALPKVRAPAGQRGLSGDKGASLPEAP